MNKTAINKHLDEIPLVAILRGVTPDEVIGIGDALFEAGIRVVEVTMNSPIDPLKSIERLSSRFQGEMAVGAGTVLSPEEVDQVKESGARFVVSPNTNEEVIRRTAELGLYSLPGVATCSEGFQAIAAGADALKIFPASAVGPAGLRDMTAVFPKEVGLYAVGGVSASNLDEWLSAGACGAGLGSCLYRAGDSPEECLRKSRLMVGAYQATLKE
ncbi:MAG: 2-dehydro-3-deoxy-6-phosphogalactonate aldolase [Akkermansiaceae bacterium]